MNWLGLSSKRKSSRTRRKSSGKRRASSGRKRRTSSSKRHRFTIVKGAPRVAHPKPTGRGYYYTRRASNGKVQKISVTGRTYTKQEAKQKVSKLRR